MFTFASLRNSTTLVVDVAVGLDPHPEHSPVYLGPYGASKGDDFASSNDISRHQDSYSTTTIKPQPTIRPLDTLHPNLEEVQPLDTREEHSRSKHHHNCIRKGIRRFMAVVQQYPQTHMRRASPFGPHDRQAGLHATIAKPTNVSDSDSDDDPPPAIKFSKVTEALLNDRVLPSSPIRYNHGIQPHRPIRSATATATTLSTPDRRSGIKILRKSSPSAFGSDAARGETPPRIIHIGSAHKGSTRKTVSISGPYPHRLAAKQDGAQTGTEIVTPAPVSRTFENTRARAASNSSQDRDQLGHSSSSRPGSRNGLKGSSDPVAANILATSLGRTTSTHHPPESISRYPLSTTNRQRGPSAEQALAPASQRIKRAPIATGTFLKSGPVRRGFRRRESEEEVSPVDDYNSAAPSHPSSNDTPHGGSTRNDALRSQASSVNTGATSVESFAGHDIAHERFEAHSSRPSSRQDGLLFSRLRTDLDYRPPSRQTNCDAARSRQESVGQHPAVGLDTAAEQPAYSYKHHALIEQKPLQRVDGVNRSFRHVSASEDQENAPPPTFKRNKDQELKLLGRNVLSVMSDDEKQVQSRILYQTPGSVQKHAVERQALHAVSSNTPHRPAPPPPPKMSVLETATATAGASTTKARKKRAHTVINGKLFTQMGRIGKGGSSEVFLVMAENYKTFAMKKVRLDNCDESAVRGFKGEIDLLKKLNDVDRVIRLYDWELNEEKQELLVLMEKGDTDLYRIMTLKNGGHDGRFDPTFTRYYWKEMLECVQAVHDHDVVHSDLKPANFLVVQGRLKLIDFGIANAIEVDHTCNVHRDSHVGTPNYMSPESIIDTSTTSSGFSGNRDAQGRPLRKDMKIGKSSDVWSLGCILYQMAYGRPPFAHIPTIPRIMAITNPKHVIEFPDTGIGGVPVPASLKGLLKRCLQRDAELRPTIPQLLSDSNEFLYPEANGAVMIRQDVLDQIINKVVERCKDSKRGLPSAGEVAQYAPSFMVKIKEMAEKI